ncbi:MAG: lysophospholipid acyltransferase family protein [Myxococcota bacterium]
MSTSSTRAGAHPDVEPIVPFAGWGLRPGRDGSVPRGVAEKIGDRALRFAEEVLGEDIEARVNRIQTFENEAGYDPFGFDPKTARYALAVSAFLHRWYFRSEVSGIKNVPQGRALIVANHSGQVPLDGVMIGAALMLDAEPPRFPRSMVERWVQELPFISVFFPRCGQVLGSPDNARRLLNNDETLVVFPEGVRGISKTFDQRYQLANFGLGFMRLALETKTPIVPVSVIGAEEQLINVRNVRTLARLVGMPVFPVIPQLFLGAPFPLPVRYRLQFGEPIVFDGDPDDDDAVIEQKVFVVRNTIQTMLARGLSRRSSVFF